MANWNNSPGWTTGMSYYQFSVNDTSTLQTWPYIYCESGNYTDHPTLDSGDAALRIRKWSATGWTAVTNLAGATATDPGAGHDYDEVTFVADSPVTMTAAGEYVVSYIYNRSGTYYAYYLGFSVRGATSGTRIISLTGYDTPEVYHIVWEDQAGNVFAQQDPT